jgi:hypothetical protein
MQIIMRELYIIIFYQPSILNTVVMSILLRPARVITGFILLQMKQCGVV